MSERTRRTVARWIASLAVGLVPVDGVEAQSRAFWVLDRRSSHLFHGAPGLAASQGVVLPGYPRHVRATPTGQGVVCDPIGGAVTVMSSAAATTIPMSGGVTDAAPDGASGAWVASRLGPTSEISHVDQSGSVTLRSTVAGVATSISMVRDGLVMVVTRVQSVSWVTLLDGTGTVVLDAMVLPQHPSSVVLLNDARVMLPGAVTGAIPVIDTTTRTIVVDGFIPVMDPVLTAAPICGTQDVVVIDGAPPSVRRIDLSGAPAWSVVVPSASALESLPTGDVLVHQAGIDRAWVLDRFGFASWSGPWPASYGTPDGPGMQFARATPEADPDADGFDNATEVALGSDPGDSRSAPLAAWREASQLRLAARDGRVTAYLVVASDQVVAGSDPVICAPGPLLYSSLVAGVCFDAPFGVLAGGGAAVTMLSGLPADPWIAVAGFDPGLSLLHSLDARRLSEW